MAAPVVASVGSVASASTTSAAIPVPSGVATGDLIIAFLFKQNNAAVTAPSGWTALTPQAPSTDTVHYAWYKVATAADTGTYTFSWTGAIVREAVAVRVTGASTTTPIDTGAGVPNSAGRASAATVTPAVSLTTQGPDRLLVWSGANFSGGTAGSAWTPPSGYTENYDGARLTLASVSQAVPGGTGSVTGTCTTSEYETAWLFAVVSSAKAASGSPTAAMALAGSSAGTKAASSSRTGSMALAAARSGSRATSSSATASMALTATRGGGRNSGGSATAAMTLVASAPGARRGGPIAAALALTAVLTGPAHATTRSRSAALTLVAAAGAQARDGSVTRTAALTLTTSRVGTHANLGNAVLATLVLGASISGHRVITAISGELLLRPAPTNSYELVCVARIPQPSGPPTFIEVDPIDWTGLSFTDELSKASMLQAGCKVSQLTEPVLQRLRNPAKLATELWLRRNGRLVFAGPLRSAQVQGEALTFNASSAFDYLQQMVVTADTVFSGVDQHLMVRALVDQWQVQSYGNFGIDTSGVTPSGVVRDGTYLAKELHVVGARVFELGQRQNGFDLTVDPASRKLLLDFPQRGVDRSTGEDAVIFDERNITSPNLGVSLAPNDVGSEGFGTGTGDSTLYSVKSNPDLRAQYGRTALTATFDGVVDQVTCDAHTQAVVDARGTAVVIPGPDARVTVDSDIATYDVGDTVSYTAHSLLTTASAFRLQRRTVTVSPTGQEAVSVQFV